MSEKPKKYKKKSPVNSIVAGDKNKRHTLPEWLKPYQFQPGVSGNPKGPSVKLANEVKAFTGGGTEMVHVMIRIMRGESIPGVMGTPTYNHVQESARWLAEQAFGKAPLMMAADDGTYNLQRLLYVELSKRSGEAGVYDITDESILLQGLEENGTDKKPD